MVAVEKGFVQNMFSVESKVALIAGVTGYGFPEDNGDNGLEHIQKLFHCNDK